MVESTFLSRDEIKELTERTVFKSQVEQLQKLGITYRTRSDGTPVVLRSHLEQEFGGMPGTKESHNEEPEWDGLNVA